MSINAQCGSCNRELLLGQLVQPSNGFRCPVCGFAFAPAYATVAPGVAARVMVAQAALVTELAELGESSSGHRQHDRRGPAVEPGEKDAARVVVSGVVRGDHPAVQVGAETGDRDIGRGLHVYSFARGSGRI